MTIYDLFGANTSKERETFEEIGLDLSSDKAIPIGNLNQRLVTTSTGRVPLMVLCPYSKVGLFFIQFT